MSDNIFQTVQHHKELSLSERVALQISALIKERNIVAGEKLPNEFELAESLNVGRGTIREAVKLLVARNVLEIRRGRGTFVAESTGSVKDPFGFSYITKIRDKIRLAEELYEIRHELEPWIASLAAERIAEEEKIELQNRCDVVKQMILEGKDHNEADNAFHQYIAQCTHNSVLMEIIPTITYSISIFTSFKQWAVLDATIKNHQMVTDAICANDPVTAKRAMEIHLAANLQSIQLMKDWAEEHGE